MVEIGVKKSLGESVIQRYKANPVSSSNGFHSIGRSKFVCRKRGSQVRETNSFDQPCKPEYFIYFKRRNGMSGRKIKAENEVHKPLIWIERTVYEKGTFKLSAALLLNLSQYVAYVKDVTGDEASPDEIVEKGMQRLFDADRGFRQWLQTNHNKTVKVIREERIVRTSEKRESTSSDQL
jgi:hypothetical protein